MINSIHSFFQTIAEALKSAFDYFKTGKERQSETAILKDRKKLEKAVNTAEKIIRLLDIYQVYFEKTDRLKFERLRNEFERNN